MAKYLKDDEEIYRGIREFAQNMTMSDLMPYLISADVGFNFSDDSVLTNLSVKDNKFLKSISKIEFNYYKNSSDLENKAFVKAA